jgi:hypothetical protein
VLPGFSGPRPGFWLHTVPGALPTGPASDSTDTVNPRLLRTDSASVCERPITFGTSANGAVDVGAEPDGPDDEGCGPGAGDVLAGGAGPA